MYTSNVLLCLMVVAAASAQSFKEKFGDRVDSQKMAEKTKLIDLLSFRALYMLPQSVKTQLKQFSVKDVQDLQQVLHQLPQATDLNSAISLVKAKSPKLHEQLTKVVKEAKDKFAEKKQQLSPDAVQVFDQLEKVMAESMKKSAKIVASIKPQTKQNILKVFPNLEHALNTPAAKKAIQNVRVALAV